MEHLHLSGAYWLAIVISAGVPLVVGLVTKTSMHAGIKVLLLLFLSAANGTLLEIQASSGGVSVGNALLATIGSFVISIAVHKGVYRPVGMTQVVQESLVTDKSERGHPLV